MDELATISKLQSAKLAVREVKEVDEIKRIIDQVEALKSYAKAQKLSAEIQNDIAEYALYATRQMGTISANIEKAAGQRNDLYQQTEEVKPPASKAKVLADAGIDIRRANEAEKLTAIPDDEFTTIVEKKKNQGDLSKSAVSKAVKQIQKQAMKADKAGRKSADFELSENDCNLICADIRNGLPEILNRYKPI